MSVWIIGGTTESVEVVEKIASITSDFVITTVTPEAKQLYPLGCKVVVGRMSEDLMQGFCDRYQINAILDASHPFAVEVSQSAIALAARLNIAYLRYERAETTSNTTEITNNCLRVNGFNELLNNNYLVNRRVLLTIGCKALPLFKPWQEKSTLFARILPKKESLQIALNSGFTSDRIIAIRPPVGEELELALWRQWNISLVVTKASGKSGGEEIKYRLAKQLNIPLIVISRPQISYPQQTFSLDDVIHFLARVTAKEDASEDNYNNQRANT